MFRRVGRTHATFTLLAIGIALGVSATALGVEIGDRAFRPAGTSRYAWDSATNLVNTGSTTFYVDMPNLSQSVAVPSGKRADLFITFSGTMRTEDITWVQAVVDGNVARPGPVPMVYFVSNGPTAHSFTFFKVVNSGNHIVKIQWRTDSNESFVSHRSMMVTANIY